MVMLPVYLYDPATLAMADDAYLFLIDARDAGEARYYLCTEGAYVAEYIAHVEIDTQQSAFQSELAYWYIEKYVETAEGE